MRGADRMRKQEIKLDMSHYKSNPRKLSEKEKIDRLFVLAKEINVCVGNERKRDGRDIGVLP